MGKLRLGAHTRKLLCEIADEQPPAWGEQLTADEWEVVCACMGLQIMTQGNLPPEVAVELRVLMSEMSLRTGLPLHLYEPEAPERGH